MFQFSKALRLHTSAAYKQVFNAPKKIRIAYRGLSVLALGTALDQPRIGIVISKREVPLAWQRNSFKRHIRESFRHQQAKLAGFDIVIMLKRDVLSMSKPEFRYELEKLWQKILARK